MVLNKTAVHLIAIGTLLFLTVLVYSNSFQGEFTLDDYVNIHNSPGIRTFQPTLEGIVQAAADGPNSNRWLANLTFAFNYYLNGEDTWGYHLVNLLVHLAGAVVFFSLSLTTLRLPVFRGQNLPVVEISLAAALLWAVHPLQTNGVTYIVQRMTSMSSLLYLASLLCWVRGRLAGKDAFRQISFFAASLLFWLMAVLSKENAYMLPVIILGYEIYFLGDVASRKKLQQILIYFSAATVVAALLFLFLTGKNFFSEIFNMYQYRDFTMVERLFTESRVFFFYLSLILLPLPSRLNLNHDIAVSHGILSPPQTLFSMVGIVAILALIRYLYNKNRLLSFGIFWFMANLVIESTVIPLELVYEHRLYLPSTFLLLGITAICFQLARSHLWIVRGAAMLLIICLSIWTWQRNQVWADNLTLWSDVVAKSPNSDRARNNLGTVYHDRGRLREAEQNFILAIGLAPDSRLAYVSLGSLYITWNRYQEAIQMLEAALARQTYLNPSRIYHYMGIIYSRTGRNGEAFSAAQKALQLSPDDLEPMITMGIASANMGKYKEADTIFAESEQKGLSGTNLYNNWGTVAFKLGQTDRAIELFRKSLRFDPDHPESHYNLGLAYGAKGLTAEARKEMMRAMELQQKTMSER